MALLMQRGLLVAVPVYAEPEATNNNVLIVVHHQRGTSLYHRGNGPGGTIQLTLTQDLPPELQQHPLKVADNLGKCIKIGAPASSGRKVYGADDWEEVTIEGDSDLSRKFRTTESKIRTTVAFRPLIAGGFMLHSFCCARRSRVFHPDMSISISA